MSKSPAAGFVIFVLFIAMMVYLLIQRSSKPVTPVPGKNPTAQAGSRGIPTTPQAPITRSAPVAPPAQPLPNSETNPQKVLKPDIARAIEELKKNPEPPMNQQQIADKVKSGVGNEEAAKKMMTGIQTCVSQGLQWITPEMQANCLMTGEALSQKFPSLRPEFTSKILEPSAPEIKELARKLGMP